MSVITSLGRFLFGIKILTFIVKYVFISYLLVLLYAMGLKLQKDYSDENLMGDLHRTAKITRLQVPRNEIGYIFDHVKTLLVDTGLFSGESIGSLAGIGSTRQYLQEGYEKPYAGDLDLIIQADCDKEGVGILIENLEKILSERGYKVVKSLGNISFFIPVEGHEEQIQIDIMVAPTSKNDAIYNFMKDVRYYSAEPYQPYESGGYLKGAHRNTLMRSMLYTQGYLMNNFGIYRKKYVDSVTTSMKHEMLSVLADKSKNRITPKLRSNLGVVHSIIENGSFAFAGKYSKEKDTIAGVVLNDALYDEIRNLLVEKEYVGFPVETFLEETFGWNDIHTFDQALSLLSQQYRKKKISRAIVTSIITSFQKELQSGNKGTLWFPVLEEKIRQEFDFVSFVEE